MTISPDIEKYIENSKINGRLCKWDKSSVNVFVTPITANVSDKNFLYSEIQRAISVWNNSLKQISINLMFNITNTPENADIVVHWTKVGRVFEGMCKYPSIINGILKKISIDIGLPNEFSGKNTTNESIFSTILHELGHSMGLGHGVDIDDVMFVPHKKNIAIPSENDLYVLKLIYSY
ncbi:hypothetical protein IJ707_01730 [bacterium]|nr:hypothetical protein [bacterium]